MANILFNIGYSYRSCAEIPYKRTGFDTICAPLQCIGNARSQTPECHSCGFPRVDSARLLQLNLEGIQPSPSVAQDFRCSTPLPLEITAPTIMKSNSAPTLRLNNIRRNNSVEVLQITDLHLLSEPEKRLLGVKTDETARQVIELAKSKTWPPDLIVLTGDLTQEPLAPTYRRLDQTLQSLGVPCVCLPGNHDDPLLMQRELNSENVYCATQILSDAWQIICLDSSKPESEAGYFTGETLEMLENYLDRFPEKFALVCLHHHPVLIGSAWLDTMVLAENDKFFAILKSHSQSRGVACGHIHQALDTTYENLQVFGTPSTCFQFKAGSANFLLDNKAPGFRHFSLHPDGTIETQVFRLPEPPNGLNLLSSGYRK